MLPKRDASLAVSACSGGRSSICGSSIMDVCASGTSSELLSTQLPLSCKAAGAAFTKDCEVSLPTRGSLREQQLPNKLPCVRVFKRALPLLKCGF